MKKTITYLLLIFIVSSCSSQKSNEEKKNIPWVRDSYNAISVKTPEKLELKMSKVPDGYEETINTLNMYVGKTYNETIIYVTYMDSNFEQYDLKEGMSSSIGNSLHMLKGSLVNSSFEEVNNDLYGIIYNGEFDYENNKEIIKGYGYWNDNGKLGSVVCFSLKNGRNSTEIKEEIDKIISSVNISF
jgi:hypothetical protein